MGIRTLPARREAGLTLIEVLLAAAILATGLTALMVAASRGITIFKLAKRYQQVQWALNLGMLEHPMLPTDDPDEWNVDADEIADGFTFKREVEEKDETERDGLLEVRTSVEWTQPGGRGVEEIVEYVLDPRVK